MGHTVFITITQPALSLHSYAYQFSVKVNRRAPSPKLEGTNNSGDADTLVEMCAAMEELNCYNQALEDDVYNIRQHQQESNPPKEMDLLDP